VHGLRPAELAYGQKGCPSGHVRAGVLVIWPAHPGLTVTWMLGMPGAGTRIEGCTLIASRLWRHAVASTCKKARCRPIRSL